MVSWTYDDRTDGTLPHAGWAQNLKWARWNDQCFELKGHPVYWSGHDWETKARAKNFSRRAHDCQN